MRERRGCSKQYGGKKRKSTNAASILLRHLGGGKADRYLGEAGPAESLGGVWTKFRTARQEMLPQRIFGREEKRETQKGGDSSHCSSKGRGGGVKRSK